MRCLVERFTARTLRHRRGPATVHGRPTRADHVMARDERSSRVVPAGASRPSSRATRRRPGREARWPKMTRWRRRVRRVDVTRDADPARRPRRAVGPCRARRPPRLARSLAAGRGAAALTTVRDLRPRSTPTSPTRSPGSTVPELATRTHDRRPRRRRRVPGPRPGRGPTGRARRRWSRASVARRRVHRSGPQRAAGLDNVEVVPRAPRSGRRPRRDDVVTARAVAPLAVLRRVRRAAAAEAGSLVAWKGRRDAGRGATMRPRRREVLGLDAEAAVPVAPRPGADERAPLRLARRWLRRPTGYPRRPGMARKRPLGARRPEPADR